MSEDRCAAWALVLTPVVEAQLELFDLLDLFDRRSLSAKGVAGVWPETVVKALVLRDKVGAGVTIAFATASKLASMG